MVVDHLSALPDDLLRHILYFTAAKEAVSTSALSRRWRSLWLSSGAINLDTLIYDRTHGAHFSFPKCNAFFRDVDTVLAAAGRSPCPIRRLTINSETHDTAPAMLLFYWKNSSATRHVVDFVDHVLSHPAARRVEELRLRVVIDGHQGAAGDEDGTWSQGFYNLSIGSLPSEALRVLHIVYFHRLSSPEPAAAVTFPRLAELRLRVGIVSTADLQRVFDAAPHLAAVHLIRVALRGESKTFRLRCPAATTIVLSDCNYGLQHGHSLELDAPRLQQFRYKGIVQPFAMNSQAPDLRRVDLHFIRKYQVEDKTIPEQFWRFLASFTDVANVFTLRMHNYRLDDIAVVDEKTQCELLGFSFRHIESLELQVLYIPGCDTAGVAIANMLHCFPVLRDLKLRLSTVVTDSFQDFEYRREFLRRKDESNFNKCVDDFNRRRSKSGVFLDDEDDKVSDVPGLSGSSFECLKTSLRILGLQFRMEEKSNCFGVKLAKFFAKNATVLEEMYVDDGNKNLCEHINSNVERWVAAG